MNHIQFLLALFPTAFIFTVADYIPQWIAAVVQALAK